MSAGRTAWLANAAPERAGACLLFFDKGLEISVGCKLHANNRGTRMSLAGDKRQRNATDYAGGGDQEPSGERLSDKDDTACGGDHRNG